MSHMSTLSVRVREPALPAVRRRRPPSGGALLLPVGAMGAAAGVAADVNPLVGAGVGAVFLLTFLPWAGLFAALVGTSIANRAGYDISGLTLRVAEAVLVPFAFRSFFFTTPASGSMADTFGVITYLAVYTSVCSPRRVRQALRVFLAAGAIGAFIGILSLIGYYGGLKFGVDFRYKPLFGGAPTIKGLAYEHDIFGSTCAAVAIAFFVLLREQSNLFSRKWTVRYLWVSVIGMLIAQGRGPWLGFGFVFLLYFVFKRRRVVAMPRLARAAVILVLVSILGAGAFFVLNQQTENSVPGPLAGVILTTQTKFANILNTSSGTGLGRLRLWTKGTTEVMDKSPVVGLGTYSYGQRNFRTSPHTRPYLTPGYLISLWVRTLYDTGIAGVVLLALFMLLAFWPVRELQHSKGDLAPVARAMAFASLVLAGAYLITDSTLLIWPWILFGLTRAAITQATRQARDLQKVPTATGNGSSPNGRWVPEMQPAPGH